LLTVRQSYEPLLTENPDPASLSSAGVIDAALGRYDQALPKCRRAVELRPISGDPLEGPEYAANLALVYAWAGQRDHAIEQLGEVVKVPASPVCFGQLKLDPAWDVLRDDPRFDQLLAEAAKPIPLN
jgi:tetratricopeptide (TPR) repeat protein